MMFTAFEEDQRIATGALSIVAAAVKLAADVRATGVLLVFDDATGNTVELDLRGSEADVVQRALDSEMRNNTTQAADEREPEHAATAAEANAPRGRGRPKLGVVAREVTLLPQHWDWLATQPGGASVALRRLVSQGKRDHTEKDRRRACHERAYRFMSVMAGNRVGFEEASRALFANDQQRFAALVAAWPPAIAHYATDLAFADHAAQPMTDGHAC